MLNIIITIDYEIFGNGKGDVKKHILHPTDKLLDISKKYNIPFTFMFEIYEYIAFEKYNKEMEIDFGYSPAEQIKKQIQNLHTKGHDVQLHIHPQFAEMEYRQKKFIIKDPALSVLNLKDKEVYKLIKIGKEKLESLLSFNNYTCTALRLSNMPWIEAPKNTIKPMEKLGIKIHSLSAECKTKNELGYWKLNNNQVFEIPIYTISTRIYKLINLRLIFTLFYIWKYSFPKYRFIFHFSHRKLKDYNSSYCSKWDFSKLTYKDMTKYLEQAIKTYDYKRYEIPLVMIGHTKDFFNDKNFIKFLQAATREYVNKGIARFTTFREFAEKYMQTGE